MIFTFNPNISFPRKIAYIGIIFFIGSFILASMGNPADAVDNPLFKMASILSVGGLSLLLVALTHRNTKANYSRFGVASAIIAASVIPAVCLIALYLTGVVLLADGQADKYIMNNAALILAVNIPVALIVALMLDRLSIKKGRGEPPVNT